MQQSVLSSISNEEWFTNYDFDIQTAKIKKSFPNYQFIDIQTYTEQKYTLKMFTEVNTKETLKFYDEINIVKALHNENKSNIVPQIYGYAFFQKQKIFIMVLQYVDDTIQSLISKKKQLTYNQICLLASNLAELIKDTIENQIMINKVNPEGIYYLQEEGFHQFFQYLIDQLKFYFYDWSNLIYFDSLKKSQIQLSEIDQIFTQEKINSKNDIYSLGLTLIYLLDPNFQISKNLQKKNHDLAIEQYLSKIQNQQAYKNQLSIKSFLDTIRQCTKWKARKRITELQLYNSFIAISNQLEKRKINEIQSSFIEFKTNFDNDDQSDSQKLSQIGHLLSEHYQICQKRPNQCPIQQFDSFQEFIENLKSNPNQFILEGELENKNFQKWIQSIERCRLNCANCKFICKSILKPYFLIFIMFFISILQKQIEECSPRFYKQQQSFSEKLWKNYLDLKNKAIESYQVHLQKREDHKFQSLDQILSLSFLQLNSIEILDFLSNLIEMEEQLYKQQNILCQDFNDFFTKSLEYINERICIINELPQIVYKEQSSILNKQYNVIDKELIEKIYLSQSSIYLNQSDFILHIFQYICLLESGADNESELEEVVNNILQFPNGLDILVKTGRRQIKITHENINIEIQPDKSKIEGIKEILNQ